MTGVVVVVDAGPPCPAAFVLLLLVVVVVVVVVGLECAAAEPAACEWLSLCLRAIDSVSPPLCGARLCYPRRRRAGPGTLF